MVNGEIPQETNNMLIDYNERIRDILGLNLLRDYASGERKTSEFCILTDDNLYIYQTTRTKTRVIVSDVDEVTEITKSISLHKDKRLLRELKTVLIWAIIACVFAAIFYAFTTVEFSVQNMGGAIGLVCFGLLAGFSIICMLGSFIIDIIRYLRSCINVMNIKYTNGTSIIVPLYTTTDNDNASRIVSGVKAAKAARRTANKDVFMW